MDSYSKVKTVLWYTLFLNIAVAAAKVSYGYISNSISMTADGFHSMFDGTSNVIGLIGIWVASRPPDDTHPYGHKKFETFASVGIGVLLFITCYDVLKNSFYRFTNPNHAEATTISFVIMAVTISVNIAVMSWEKKSGKELNSSLLIADSMHTMSDIFASISVIATLIAIKAGYPIFDPFAAIIIAFMIGMTGYRIIKKGSMALMDTAMIDVDRVKNAIMSVKGVKECHKIRTRGMEGHICVDLHLKVDPNMNIDDAHDVSYRVEERLKNKFAEVMDVVVHIEPYKESKKDKRGVVI
ncbi:MAG: cation transporter [Nitrospirae bacterium]|nr:cation transporter [Nitrospirota bacterium]